jgi:hypothetical protein
MFQAEDVLDRKDLLCGDCLEALKRFSEVLKRNVTKSIPCSLSCPFVYAFWAAGLVALAHITFV